MSTTIQLFLTLILLSLIRPGHFSGDNSTKDFELNASIDDNWFDDVSLDDVTEDDVTDDVTDDSNSTLCSNLSSNDFSNGCQFWMQGVLLCFVGFGGVIGNSVRLYFSENNFTLNGVLITTMKYSTSCAYGHL